MIPLRKGEKDNTYQKGEEVRARLREKALSIAHEIVRKIELNHNMEISRQEYEFVIEKTKDSAFEGYFAATEIFLYLMENWK